jgi:hypothetical protein
MVKRIPLDEVTNLIESMPDQDKHRILADVLVAPGWDQFSPCEDGAWTFTQG